MKERIEDIRLKVPGPVKGLFGVLFLVIAFLLVMAGATFLVYFIME